MERPVQSPITVACIGDWTCCACRGAKQKALVSDHFSAPGAALSPGGLDTLRTAHLALSSYFVLLRGQGARCSTQRRGPSSILFLVGEGGLVSSHPRVCRHEVEWMASDKPTAKAGSARPPSPTPSPPKGVLTIGNSNSPPPARMRP